MESWKVMGGKESYRKKFWTETVRIVLYLRRIGLTSLTPVKCSKSVYLGISTSECPLHDSVQSM